MPTVMNYDIAEPLAGECSPALAQASREAEPTGAVCAYLEDGVWFHVEDSQVEHYERNLRIAVVTVYVEE